MSGVTLQRATGIANACPGSFTDEQNLEIVVSRGNILELLRPDENGKMQDEEMKRDGEEKTRSGSSSEEPESSSDGSENEEETMYDSEFRESGGSSSASSSESESDSEEDYVEEEEEPSRVPGGKPQHALPKLDLPPVPKVDLKLQPNQGLMSMGSISAVMGAVVVVESTGQQRVLDAGSVLWLQKARTPLGLVDDLFGPVQRPFYSVRFNDPSEIPAGAEVGVRVGYNSEHAQFVLDDANLHKKGCDASGAHDEELPENEIEFSDDEREQEAKSSKRKQKRKAPKKETVKSLETERRQRAPQDVREAERPQRGPQEGRGDGGRGGRGRARARGRSRPDHSQHANSGPHPDMHFHELEARRRHESYRDHEPPHPQHHNQQQWQPPLPPHPPPSHGPPRPHFNSVAPPLPPGLHPQDMATGNGVHPPFPGPHAVPNLAQQPWPPLPEQPMLPRLVHQPPLPESMRPPTSFLPVSAVSYAPFQFSAPQTLGTEAMVLCNPAPPLPVNPPMPAGRPSHESMMHSSVSHAHAPPMPPGMPGAQGMIQSTLQPQLHSQLGPGMPGSGPPPPQGSWITPMPQMLPGHVAQPGVGQFAPRPW